jgi:nickel-type superoxide dismutase maturation protease
VLAAVLAAALGVAFRSATTRITRVEVEGLSMVPTLAPGDRLVVVATRELRVGDLVVANSPTGTGPLVKRIAAITGGRITLIGDNPGASTDSRHFGPLDPREILGVARYRYAPGARAGRLERGER